MVKAKGRTGRNPLGYQGVEPSTPPNLVLIPRAPTADDVYNFEVGTFWVNSSKLETIPPTIPVAEDIYMLGNIKGTVADWIQFGTGVLNTFTGDDGVIVDQDANDNINVKGTTGRISVVGDPPSFDLTWDIGATVALTFDTDSGSATISSNTLNILGGDDCSTSGSGNTVTIIGDTVIAVQYTTDSGIVTPSSNNVNVVGGAGYTTSGAGDTLTIADDGTQVDTYTTDSGTASPVAGNINIVGGGDLVTTASGNTINVSFSQFSPNTGFLVYLSANQLNTTGNGNNFVLPWDTAIFNVNNDFDLVTDHAYIAPVTGVYFFTTTITVANLSTGMTALRNDIYANSTAFLFAGDASDVYPIRSLSNGYLTLSSSVVLSLNANDKVFTRSLIQGGAGNTVTIIGGTSPTLSWFSGYRIA